MGGYRTSVRFPFGLVHRTVWAGPYRMVLSDEWGVRLAPEIAKPAAITLQIADFSTPQLDDLYSALRAVLFQMARRNPVYVGCGWGRGRTGTFLACLTKVLVRTKDPVYWIRTNYNPYAVENSAQEDFVYAFDPRPLRWMKYRQYARALASGPA